MRKTRGLTEEKPSGLLRPLSEKQARFVTEYLVDLDASKAAERAGYSAKSKGQLGWQLLQIPSIGAAVRAAAEKRSERTGITADVVLGELLRLARVDIAGAFTPDGALKPIHEIPEDVRRAISGVEVFEEFSGFGNDREQTGWTKKIKFWDKGRALEMLAKHLALFNDRSTTVNLDAETLRSLPEWALDELRAGKDPLLVLARAQSRG